MLGISPLLAFWSLLFIAIALFYLFRLVGCRGQIRHFDAESEAGHGVMAIGMVFMLAPLGSLTPGIILWNIIVFAIGSLWFTGRLFARQSLLALLLHKNGAHAMPQSDAIHVFMYVGMGYMFLLISSMSFSMALPVVALNYGFCLSFALLLLQYCREISKDLQIAKMDWLKLGADVAHALMSGVMSWMFIGMIFMTMRMGTP
jgi:hypothetical protein